MEDGGRQDCISPSLNRGREVMQGPCSPTGNNRYGHFLAHSPDQLQIEAIDPVKRRISLKPLDRRIAELKPGELAVGAEVEGIVESIQPFGVFVRLSEEKTGLLHISETDVPKQGSPAAQLERKFEPSSKIKVVVK